MFPSSDDVLDIQSWWEVPYIAYFCSLFRTAFNLLDFDIEELEEALLTDGIEESTTSLITELIVRLLNGCLGNNDISTFNYQMYLRRLFRKKCQETRRSNPFDSDIDFQFLPVRSKVEILYALCNFRLDADDVFDLFKNLEAESLRVEPVGWDDNESAYWYFYGTRLYREDIVKNIKVRAKKKKSKEEKKRGLFYVDDWLDDNNSKRIWQVVCFTEEDWNRLTDKFSLASSKAEKELFRSLSQNFLPEIPRLFQEKEKLQCTRSESLGSSFSREKGKSDMPLQYSKRSRSSQKDEPPKNSTNKTGRKTNNSLASATGKIDILDNNESVNSNRKKLKTSQIFRQTQEDIQTDMYKVLEQLTAHHDAWPFIDPVEEDYAPNYYTVIRRPMDLRKMEGRLDNGYYTDFSMFKADFKLIVNNCRLYNGQDNEYTKMVDNLQLAFDRLTEKYMHRLSSSDEDIAVEYQLSMPRRQYKRKSTESSTKQKRKKRKYYSESGDGSSTVHVEKEEKNKTSKPNKTDTETKNIKGFHMYKEENFKKKKQNGYYRHCKKSKILRKGSKNSGNTDSKKYPNNSEEGKKRKKLKKNNHNERNGSVSENLKQIQSQESLESSNRSRSASPLPSIHTPSPSPTKLDPLELKDIDFFKDKYEKIKDATKAAWESLFDYKQKTIDKGKQNLKIPDKDKNHKLVETIEKLRAKSEKYRDSSLFSSQFTSNLASESKCSDTIIQEYSNNQGKDLSFSEKKTNKQEKKDEKEEKNCLARNESASEALEQAVKDISKWLDDAPEGSTESSTCDSLAYIISAEGHDSSRQYEEFSKTERTIQVRKEFSRKRPSSREPKILLKRREIHRTIERLQPGKSKGNLLTNTCNKNTEKIEEVLKPGTLSKVGREIGKGEETSPKLSLGSVLHTVNFSLGKDDKFLNIKDKPQGLKENSRMSTNVNNYFSLEVDSKNNYDVYKLNLANKDAEIGTNPVASVHSSQDKATPNLSAWFKAFGASKGTKSVLISNKEKPEESESYNKPALKNTNESKSPTSNTKYDSITVPETQNKDERDSPLTNITIMPRQRRTSTVSSISERSSFSQDLDSPRHQVSHMSPLVRSPTSPRIDDLQKITYPIINGTIRAGFYQDMTCMKSSPEKCSSPRGAPQSPFSPYSQHVYASNNAPTPYYFKDNCKNPLPMYSVNSPMCYDTNKAPRVNKDSHTHEDYTSLDPVSYQHNECSPYSAAHFPYLQSQTTNHYDRVLNYPQTSATESVIPVINTNTTRILSNTKKLFPVKKRIFNEHDLLAMKVAKENIGSNTKHGYQKTISSFHTMSSIQATSDDNTLKEKTETGELKNMRENIRECTYQNTFDNSKKRDYEVTAHNTKKLPGLDSKKAFRIGKKDNVDMINMGYMNPDTDPRNSSETNRDMHNPTPNSETESYEVGSVTINFGVITQKFQKSIPKSNISSLNHDSSSFESVNLTHLHQNQYESICSRQSMSIFSLSDIELANKKLYGCNSVQSPATLDYDRWKTGHQIRKQDVLLHGNLNSYNTNKDKLVSDTTSSADTSAVRYGNKNINYQQYSNCNVSNKTSLQRTRELEQNLTAKSVLRISESRSLVQNDVNISSSVSDTSLVAKNMESFAKSQSNANKIVQNNCLMGSIPYKTSYGTHSPLPLNSLPKLPNIPQILERYTNDDKYISTSAGNSSALYKDQDFQRTQMFNEIMATDVRASNTSSICSESPTVINKNDNKYNKNYLNLAAAVDTKCKRKRSSDPKQIPTQIYQTPCSTDVFSSVKTSMMPGNSFGLGSSTNMALGRGLYADSSDFSMEGFRNSTTNQLMAVNYMAAAVAQQRRNNVEANIVKLVKPAHQNPSHESRSFPFMGHSQVRAEYPFVGANPSSQLYQEYLQRREEQLLGHTGAQIMSLYPPSYPTGLGGHQPYDTLNRPSWL